MAEELLINVTPMESRVALLDQGLVNEVYIERQTKKGLVGNIYKGIVVRVLPGMQAAFIDIGLERTGFLHVNDMVKLAKYNDAGEVTFAEPKIEARLRPGDIVLVQVNKDMLGSKGARLTTNIALPSRYLVYMPFSDHIGISQRIDNVTYRESLKQQLIELMQEKQLNGGVIARTVAEGVEVQKLAEDIEYLHQLWQSVKTVKGKTNTGLVYTDLPLAERTLRDLANDTTKKILVDNQAVFARLQKFAEQFVPHALGIMSLYDKNQPMFDIYGVEKEIHNALKRRVNLSCGGYLIVDQTEAMTTIDVNTGSFVGDKNLEDTVYKTNLDATKQIARQLRMRNLGGIIIIDFIDMLEQQHKDEVMQSLMEHLAQDHAKNSITQVSELGLVEMTRKRTRESLEQVLCEDCEVCNGRGYVKTADTVCFEIIRELMRIARSNNQVNIFNILAHDAVINVLLTSQASVMNDLTNLLNVKIEYNVDANCFKEQFNITIS